ncbi:MAG: CRISPR-associated protein Cas4 [Chloroflexota bacterium]
MDPDDFDVPISTIEHFSYCPRQCALIHVEQTYEENLYTIRGSLAHERADSGLSDVARGVRTLRSVPLWSARLGLRGKADLVELRAEGPYPVEYKVGIRHGPHADLQLCAQALCLEEMLGCAVHEGAVFYRAMRKRLPVSISPELRQRTERLIVEIRAMLTRQLLPPAPNDRRCRNCSLIDACLPSVVAETNRVRGLQGALFVPYDPPTDGSSMTG